MTARVDYKTELVCDQPKCRERFAMPCHWSYTRKQAVAAGWSCDTFLGDFCPAHNGSKDAAHG